MGLLDLHFVRADESGRVDYWSVQAADSYAEGFEIGAAAAREFISFCRSGDEPFPFTLSLIAQAMEDKSAGRAQRAGFFSEIQSHISGAKL